MECKAGSATVYLDQWPTPIPVSERLPEYNDDVGMLQVLAFGRRNQSQDTGWQVTTEPEWFVAFHSGPGGTWYSDHELPRKNKAIHLVDVTHWLPIPPKPE